MFTDQLKAEVLSSLSSMKIASVRHQVCATDCAVSKPKDFINHIYNLNTGTRTRFPHQVFLVGVYRARRRLDTRASPPTMLVFKPLLFLPVAPAVTCVFACFSGRVRGRRREGPRHAAARLRDQAAAALLSRAAASRVFVQTSADTETRRSGTQADRGRH